MQQITAEKQSLEEADRREKQRKEVADIRCILNSIDILSQAQPTHVIEILRQLSEQELKPSLFRKVPKHFDLDLYTAGRPAHYPQRGEMGINKGGPYRLKVPEQWTVDNVVEGWVIPDVFEHTTRILDGEFKHTTPLVFTKDGRLWKNSHESVGSEGKIIGVTGSPFLNRDSLNEAPRGRDLSNVAHVLEELTRQ